MRHNDMRQRHSVGMAKNVKVQEVVMDESGVQLLVVHVNDVTVA